MLSAIRVAANDFFESLLHPTMLQVFLLDFSKADTSIDEPVWPHYNYDGNVVNALTARGKNRSF